MLGARDEMSMLVLGGAQGWVCRVVVVVVMMVWWMCGSGSSYRVPGTCMRLDRERTELGLEQSLEKNKLATTGQCCTVLRYSFHSHSNLPLQLQLQLQLPIVLYSALQYTGTGTGTVLLVLHYTVRLGSASALLFSSILFSVLLLVLVLVLLCSAPKQNHHRLPENP